MKSVKQKNSDFVSYNLAIKWIKENIINDNGISITNVQKIIYPEVTGYYIPTLLLWGYKEEALRFGKYLVSIQNHDGSWSDPNSGRPYIFDTGQILKGLFELNKLFPEFYVPLIKGCDYIIDQQLPDGSIPNIYPDGKNLSHGYVVPDAIHLYALSPLKEVYNIYKIEKYNLCVLKAVNYYSSSFYNLNFNTLSHFHAYIVEAYIDLGFPKIAKKMLSKLNLYNIIGYIPAYPFKLYTCSTGLFQYSVCFYKLGDTNRANKLFNKGVKLQNKSGGWFGSYGFRPTYFAKEEISWANKYFLDALFLKIQTDFNKTSLLFPDKIELSDGRFDVILCEFKLLNNNSNILDVGCGKGRFLKLLFEANHENNFFGIDISEKLLNEVPPFVDKKIGTINLLPYDNNQFELVYCVEVLEHAVNINSAIKEMLRVVKENGKLVIIDKNINSKISYSISNWETWFNVKDLIDTLNSEGYFNIKIIDNLKHNNINSDLFFALIITK